MEAGVEEETSEVVGGIVENHGHHLHQHPSRDRQIPAMMGFSTDLLDIVLSNHS